MGQTATKAGVVAWGSSEHGQLGIGNLAAEDRAVPPRLVEGLRSVHVRHLVCSGHYSCAVSESGEVYTWGSGKDGQLGHGDSKDVFAPKAVRSLMSKLIRHISCAEHHVATVSESGVLYTWGKGQNGRLGHGGIENELLPKAVEALAGQHVGQVSCGDFHTACVTLGPHAHVYTWGLGLSGRLGHGDEVDHHSPAALEALAGVQITCAACGGHHSATISEPAGQLMTWGGGAFGKLGHGNRLAQTTPKHVAALAKRLVQVSLGPHHSAALTHKGEVYTWGQAGRLGHAAQGAEVDEMVPRQVVALASVFVLQVSCGHSHSAAVTETGDVWAWGASRAFGHTEPNVMPNVPTLIKVLTDKSIVQVACAVTHTIALSDFKRLNSRVAKETAKSVDSAAAARKGSHAPLPIPEDSGVDTKKPERFMESGEAKSGLVSEDQSPGASSSERPDASDGALEKKVPLPTLEREVTFLSAELKAYQEQTLMLAKLLQDAKTKLEALENENSFLKSELEVMHQCSDQADERLDTLRRHFTERIRDMERRYLEKERVWKETFSRLRSHLELGAELEHLELGPMRRPAPGGELRRGDGPADPATLGDAGGPAGEEAPGGTEGPAGAEAPRAPVERGRAGRVSLWPGGQS